MNCLSVCCYTGNHGYQNGTSSFPSREDSSTPANGVPPHLPNNDQPSNHLPQNYGHQSPTHHYQEAGSSEHVYQELQHDQTPPPPYPAAESDYNKLNWSRDKNNNSNLPYPVQRVQSESSSINHISNSVSNSNSSRSNTTSPNHSDYSTKSSIERAESLHKSSRSLLTPSPSGSGMQQSHSHSHQSIPTRSSASTPAGYQVLKKNYSSTLPHGMSGQYLSSSTGQIMKMRRHSSSSAYQTNLTQDGSGNLTMVTEV